MTGMTTWASPNGQRFQVSPDATPTLEPFFKRLHELYPDYQSLGGYANRPMRTLDGKNLGGVSTHATGHTLDIKAPDNILRQMASEFPNVKWGGNFKNHYDPVHFEFGPSRAPLAAPAPEQQPTQQAAAPMAEPQQQEPTFLQQLNGRMSNPLFQQGLGMFLAASQGGDLNQGMNAGSSRAAEMRKAMMEDHGFQQQQQQQQQVEQLLQNPQSLGNIPPALREIVRITKNLGPVQDYIVKSQTAGQTDDIKEFQYAVQNGFKGAFPDWMARKKEQQGEFAKQLVYGTDAQGNIVPMQAGTKGTLARSAMPDGVTLQRDPIKFDMGTHYGLMDPTTRQMIGTVPKNVAETERQKVVGETSGKAQVDLPAKQARAEDALKLVEKIRAHKGTEGNFGMAGKVSNIPGGNAANAWAMIEQVRSKAFLEAFNQLRGGGAITEAEGQKATLALIRAQESQSYPAFLEALTDFEHNVKMGLSLARQQAGMTGATSAAPGISAQPQAAQPKRLKFNPQTGELE
jgi:hypothetical protein